MPKVRAWKNKPDDFVHESDQRFSGISNSSIFRESFFIGISNPKAIAFYTALFPQFIDNDGSVINQLVILGAIFAFCSFLFLSLYAAMSSKLSVVINKRSVQLWLNRITGGLFVGFGVALATSNRV